MSVFGGKADMAYCSANARLWPKADMPSCTATVRFVWGERDQFSRVSANFDNAACSPARVDTHIAADGPTTFCTSR